MSRRKERQKGSAAIEAVVCLTIFMVAIMTILSFINICRAQAAVSYAVDAAAKEMSQYAYFYHLTGLDKLQQQAQDKVSGDRETLNKIVGGTEAVYKVFSTLGSDNVTSQDIDDLVNGAVETVMGPEDETSKGNEPISMENAVSKITEATAAVSSIKDPMQFLKSVATIGVAEGASFLTSQLIAAPLAKVLVEKHLEVFDMDADTYLRTLHIEGMDALNFSMSTIFAPATPNDVHLVCYYEVKPVQFFNFDFGKVVLCKEAVTRAWLGGDRVYKAEGEQKKESEEGIWDMGSLKYGKYIVNKEREKLLNQNCYDMSGSGADAFREGDNTLIHIRSMDMYSDSYQDPGKVRDSLRQEYSKLASMAENGRDTVEIKDGGEKKEIASPQGTRKLHIIIVVPEGEMTEAFQKGLEEAYGDLKKEGLLTYEVIQGYGTSPNNRKENGKPAEGGGS